MKCSVNERSHGDPAEIKSLVRGKSVWDVGAGDGAFAQVLRDLGADVTCVEIDPVLAFQCREKGLDTIEEDFEDLIPDCEVIYAFLSFVGNYKLTRWLQRHDFKGVVITQYYPLHVSPLNYWKPDDIILSDLPFLVYDFSSHS